MGNPSERPTIRTGTTRLTLNSHFIGLRFGKPSLFLLHASSALPPVLCSPSPEARSVFRRLTRCIRTWDVLSHGSHFFFPTTTSWYAMSARQISHSSQPITTKGMGRHFSSPRKQRDRMKSRTSAPVPGHAFKQQKLLDELHDLLVAQPSGPDPPPSSTPQAVSLIPESAELLEGAPMGPEDTLPTFDDEGVPCGPTMQRVRTSFPTARSTSMCDSWKAMILTIVDPFLNYTTATLGQPLVALRSPLAVCSAGCQDRKPTTILCLFLDHKSLQPTAISQL